MKKDSILYIVVFTFICTFVFVFVIALADRVSAARVAANLESIRARSFLYALGEDEASDRSTDTVDVLAAYNRIFGQVRDAPLGRIEYNGEPLLVKAFEGQGLWGPINGVLIVDAAVSRIIGLDFISHSETPGLGGRIDEDWFKRQFRGEQIDSAGITIRKGEGGADSDTQNAVVDGVSGATLTSAAVQTIINNELKTLRTEAAE